MRVLIDECVDPRSALEDGPLLTAAQHEFDVLLIIDRKMEFQQNLSKTRMGMVVAHHQAIQDELLLAISRVRPGEVIHTTPTW